MPGSTVLPVVTLVIGGDGSENVLGTTHGAPPIAACARKTSKWHRRPQSWGVGDAQQGLAGLRGCPEHHPPTDEEPSLTSNLPTTNCRPPTAKGKQPTANPNHLPTANWQTTANRRLATAIRQPPINCQRPTAN